MADNLDGFGLIFLLSMIEPLITLTLMVITIGIAFYAFKRFPGTSSSLIVIAVILKTISSLAGMYLQYFLIHRVGHNDISSYYIVNGVIGRLGYFLFLVGIMKLLQELYRKSQGWQED